MSENRLNVYGKTLAETLEFGGPKASNFLFVSVLPGTSIGTVMVTEGTGRDPERTSSHRLG